MSVDKLVGFVDLCRSFGVDSSPAESSAFVQDFGALDAADRPLLEEAAVGTLARDTEAEKVVRRLFRIYFSGGATDREEPDAPGNEFTEDRRRTPLAMPGSVKLPGTALSADQLRRVADALEALARPPGTEDAATGEPCEAGDNPAGAGLPAQLLAEAADVLAALMPPGNRAQRSEPPRPQAVQQALERLLRELARQREARRQDPGNGRKPGEEGGETGDDGGEGAEGDAGEGAEGQDGAGANGQGEGSGQDGQGQGQQGQDGQGMGQQGRNGQGKQGFGQAGQGQQGMGGQGVGQPPETADGAGLPGTGMGGPISGRGQGLGPLSFGQADAAVQRLGAACAALIAAGAVAPDTAARIAAALKPSLGRAFTAQIAESLRGHPSPARRERLEQALEAVAGRSLAAGEISPSDAVRLLAAADERLRAQTLVSGAGLRSLLHDAEALSDLLQRYRRRRDLLPVLVARLADALRRMLTRPSPVMTRSDAGRLDFRATIRESLAFGGVPIEFRYRRKRQEHEIVLALDTSGSQRAWAASAVLSAYALGRLLPRLRAFSFSSDVTDVTRYLPHPHRFVEHLDDFGGFSNYQTALTQLEKSGALSRRTTLILVGDCRDAQGQWAKEKEGRYKRFLDPESAHVMSRLVKQCKRVVLLNPEEESRWSSGDSAAAHYAAAGATVLYVSSPLHLAEQLAKLSLTGR